MHGLLVYSLIRFIKVHKYQFKYHIADKYLTFQNLGTISTGFGKTKDQKMETVFRIIRKFTTSYFTHKIIDFETTKLMSGSFHFLFFVFWSKWPKPKKSAVLFVYFLYKKSTFCLKMTADFLFFGYFDQNTKNEKRNEPNYVYYDPKKCTFSCFLTFMFVNFLVCTLYIKYWNSTFVLISPMKIWKKTLKSRII